MAHAGPGRVDLPFVATIRLCPRSRRTVPVPYGARARPCRSFARGTWRPPETHRTMIWGVSLGVPQVGATALDPTIAVRLRECRRRRSRRRSGPVLDCHPSSGRPPRTRTTQAAAPSPSLPRAPPSSTRDAKVTVGTDLPMWSKSISLNISASHAVRFPRMPKTPSPSTDRMGCRCSGGQCHPAPPVSAGVCRMNKGNGNRIAG